MTKGKELDKNIRFQFSNNRELIVYKNIFLELFLPPPPIIKSSKPVGRKHLRFIALKTSTHRTF